MGVIQRQGIKNAIISYVGIAIAFLSLLVIQPVILSPSEIGLTRLLLSVSSVLATVMPMGMINVTIRFFSLFNDRSRHHYGFFPFVLLVTLSGYLLFGAIVYLFRERICEVYAVRSGLFSEYFNWVFLLSFFITFSSVISAYCSANLKTTIPTFINDIYLRVGTPLIFAAYYFQLMSLEFMVFGFVMIYGTQFIGLLAYANQIDRIKFSIDLNYLKSKNISMMMEYGLLFTIGGLSSIGLRYFDSIILGVYLPLSAVGVYSICAFIPTIIEVPLTALEKISNPKIAQFWEQNQTADIEKTYALSVRVLSIVSSFIFLMILINLRYLLQLLPEEYGEAYTAVIIIAAGALVNAFTGINNSILFFSKKYKTGLLLLLYLLIATLVLDIILIPRFGMNGAAAATCLAITQYNLAKFLYLKRSFGMNPYRMENLKVVLVLVLLSVSYYFSAPLFENTLISTILLSLVYTLIFGGLLTLMGVVNPRKLGELKKAFIRA